MGESLDESLDRMVDEMSGWEDRDGEDEDGSPSRLDPVYAPCCRYCGKGPLEWKAYDWNGQERWRLVEMSGQRHECFEAWEARERAALRRAQWPTSRR